MILPIIIASTLGILFADHILYQPPRKKTPEEEVTAALAKYVKSIQK